MDSEFLKMILGTVLVAIALGAGLVLFVAGLFNFLRSGFHQEKSARSKITKSIWLGAGLNEKGKKLRKLGLKYLVGFFLLQISFLILDSTLGFGFANT